ncbi:MAG: hypothetical protein ACI9WR_001142 [Paracoccaceae bacterium]|jgi:hypothetical protein
MKLNKSNIKHQLKHNRESLRLSQAAKYMSQATVNSSWGVRGSGSLFTDKDKLH